MGSDAEELLHALTEASAHQARSQFCRDSGSLLQACGYVLWAFGLAEEPLRRAVALVLQMAGRLTAGAITMLEAENWYAAGALVRQLIETEYLLFRFASDSKEADKWLTSTSAEIRSFFGPGAMRKRSGSQFRIEEYAVHCERGGHPNPRAGFLLPEHALVPEMLPFGSLNWLWVDSGPASRPHRPPHDDTPRRKTVPPTHKHSRSPSSGWKELIAKEKTEKQSAKKRTALDNRFHRTFR